MRLDATEALAPHDVPFRVTDRLIGDEDVGTVLAPCGDEAAHDEQSVVALGGKVLHLAVDGGRQRDSGPVSFAKLALNASSLSNSGINEISGFLSLIRTFHLRISN